MLQSSGRTNEQSRCSPAVSTNERVSFPSRRPTVIDSARDPEKSLARIAFRLLRPAPRTVRSIGLGGGQKVERTGSFENSVFHGYRHAAPTTLFLASASTEKNDEFLINTLSSGKSYACLTLHSLTRTSTLASAFSQIFWSRETLDWVLYSVHSVRSFL